MRKMEKIRSWPRWLRFGLLSGFVASIIYMAGLFMAVNLSDFFGIINSGVVIPAIFIGLIIGRGVPSHAFHWQDVVLALGFWFLVGALLGKFTKSIQAAVESVY